MLESDGTLRCRGQVETRDGSWGLMSRPAYLGYLAQAAAEQIADQLAQAIEGADDRR